MYTTNLGGHSGCTVLLCEEDDDTVFVRKISSSLEYNDRLRIQADKQACYRSKILKTPQVLSDGYNGDGLYYFDMEYIQGITLAEKIKTIEIGKIKPIISDILDEVIAEDTADKGADNAVVSIFRSKIESLDRNMREDNNLVVKKALKLLVNHDWSNIAKTKCHGDMTLENIIIKDSQLYLIDFLDSFYNSWILDIGTLLQDALAMWYYRKENKINNNTLVRLVIFKDILMDTLDTKDIKLGLEAYYALLLKLIRIYPYTTDEMTYDFLNKKTSEVISIIQEREKICER